MPNPIIDNEEKIVWLDPSAQKLPYLREIQVASGTRDRTPRASLPGRIVAYAVLRPDAPSETPHRWTRRAWWIRTAEHGEADPYLPDYWPAEGVRPADVVAGRSVKF